MTPIFLGTWAQRRNKAESLNIIVNRDAQNSLSKRGTTDRRFKVEMQFRKKAIVSDVFKVMRSSFQTPGAATEKARLP